MNNTRFSQNVPVFHGRKLPVKGAVVGYAAIIESLDLKLPMPDVISIIGEKHKVFETKEWRIFSPRYQPDETLYNHLVFALKYEGINLLFFKKLFEKIDEKEVEYLLSIEATGQYSRRIWFLYEWLMERKLGLPDITIKNYVLLVDEKIQFSLKEGVKSPRHRIVNNLPGTVEFCPMVRKTEKLENYIAEKLAERKDKYLKGVRKSILQRASAFLLLKDSKASFTIEGESPKSKRMALWGQAISQAGGNELSHDELIRLQKIVIENDRFLKLGYRKKGGFIGEWEKDTMVPIPDHISCKHEDIKRLITGLIESNKMLINDPIDAVVTASVVAFGFVFIHPFVDGNGRIHRYLIHHVLVRKHFSEQGIVFPVSASILDKIIEYKAVLEHYSRPLLEFIEWKETADHNIDVLNETIDYYRYFDATIQAEFLYECVDDTINRILPEEVSYLGKYEAFKQYIENKFEMPDNMVALLVRFLEQGNGKLSKRAVKNQFKELSNDEVKTIELNFKEIFNG